MNRALLFLVLLLCSCAPIGAETDETRRVLINAVRLEIYLYESPPESECSRFLENPDLRTQQKPDLVRHSWADFETLGFGTLQIDHLKSAKKVLIFVTAIDPEKNEVIGHACAQDVEIERGVLRELQLVLQPKSHAEAKE